MDRIDVKVGFACNNSCYFCVQAHKKGVHPDRTTAEITAILEEASENYRAVVFTGGEVTIRPDVLEIVARAKELGFTRIHIQSNGRRFFYREFCEKMIEAGATEFGLALHGHVPELHDYLTSAPGSFKQTLRGIHNLASMGMNVLTNTVVTKANYRHLPELARLLVAAGVVQYQFAYVHILGNAEKYSLSVVPRKSLVAPYAKKGLDVGIEKGIPVMTEAMPYCFMENYEKYVAERIIPDTKIYDADIVIDDYTKSRITMGKAKGEPCSRCPADRYCEGPWREYVDLFGWGEFRPVSPASAKRCAL